MCDHEGVLSKKSKWMGEWRKRYLLLIGCKLFFSKDRTSTPHGLIDLLDCASSAPARLSRVKQGALEIHLKTEVVVLVAAGDAERDQWIQKINSAIHSHLNIVMHPQTAVSEDASPGGADGGLLSFEEEDQ